MPEKLQIFCQAFVPGSYVTKNIGKKKVEGQMVKKAGLEAAGVRCC